MPRKFFPVLIFGLFLLSACGSAERPTRAPNPAATQAALDVLTLIARPTSTATATPTLTPIPPSETPTPYVTLAPAALRVTVQPGLELYTAAEIPDYVFQIDPERWTKGTQDNGTSALISQSDSNCRIESVLGSGIGRPKSLYWEDLGRFRWQIYEYATWAYAVPVSGSGLSDGASSFLRLAGFNSSACRKSQEAVLSDMMSRSEAAGEVALRLYASPTPRPGVEGFTCANNPPARLRVGDDVQVVTNGLWLRSAPRADESTQLRQYNKNPGVTIRVIGGPVCEKYVYWQVEVNQVGEGTDAIQGWFAEADARERYLIPVK